MDETRLERRLKSEVKKHGGKALKFISPGMAGVPDRIVLLPGGQAVFVEMKKTGEKLRKLQQKRVKDLEALGFKVYKLDSEEAIANFIREVFY